MVDDVTQKICSKFQPPNRNRRAVINDESVRLQWNKSVSTGRTSRVGGQDDVVEGRVTSWEAVCVVTAAWELWLTSCRRFLQGVVEDEAVRDRRVGIEIAVASGSWKSQG